MSKFQFKCPHCSRILQCDDRYQGRQIRCPPCRQVFPFSQALARVRNNGCKSCRECNKSLDGLPIITIHGDQYCFTCAKKVVPALELGRQQAAKLEFDRVMTPYTAEKKAFEERHSQWVERRKVVIQTNPWTDRITSPAVLICALIGCSLIPGWGLLAGGFVGIFVGASLESSEDQRLKLAFDAVNPEPTFTMKPPPYPTITPVIFQPVLTATETKFYNRYQILERDDYTCQNCGERKQQQ